MPRQPARLRGSYIREVCQTREPTRGSQHYSNPDTWRTFEFEPPVGALSSLAETPISPLFCR